MSSTKKTPAKRKHPSTPAKAKPQLLREGEEIGYKTGWYRKPTDYTR